MTAKLSAEAQKAVDDFRREVEDKIGVVFHGCNSLPLQRDIARKQCEDFLVELYAAQVREAEALKAWQPIETAPKDGTPVVLYMGDWLTPSFITARWNGKDWLVGQYATVQNPTHWMSLPQPPGTTRETP